MSMKLKSATSGKVSKARISWMDALSAITINEDNWWCNVILIAESLPSHVRITDLFDRAASEGSRSAIYSLAFKRLTQSVRTLSKTDEDKCLTGQGVFHQANKLVERGENLDAWLVANLVKYLVHRAKVEAIKRQTDFERDIERALLPPTNVESQRSVSLAKNRELMRSSVLKVADKPYTKLRKRDEERRNKIYIEDAPEGGPHLFVVLTGFRDPKLPLELIKVGLPLTGILRIKDPTDSFIKKNSEMLRDYDGAEHPDEVHSFRISMGEELSEFWLQLEESLNDVNNLEAYSKVIIKNVCPPQLSLKAEAHEMAAYAKDLYDRISYIVYDLYDLQCLHADYIRSMKVLRVPEETRRHPTVYMKIMNDVPEECSFVSVMIQAMIAQVEADLRIEQMGNLEPEGSVNSENLVNSGDKEISRESLSRLSHDSRGSGNAFVAANCSGDDSGHLYKHGSHLNNYPNFLCNFSNHDNHHPVIRKQLPSTSGPTIILECDQLRSKTYHVPLGESTIKLISPRPYSLAELAGRSLRDPRIFSLWSNRAAIPEEAMEFNRDRINKLARCFDVPVDADRLSHYLHLRFFDKMIHGRLNGSSEGFEDREGVIAKKEVIPEVTRSPMSSGSIENDPSSRSSGNPISNLLTSRSDSVIDYHVSGGDTAGFPVAFGGPKYSRKTLRDPDASARYTGGDEGTSYLEEFIDVRPLSPETLPQAIHECLKEYGDFRDGYLEITDSCLLCFGFIHSSKKTLSVKDNENVCTSDLGSSATFKMVSPICLRDFCRYVVPEEKDFVRNWKIMRSARGSTSASELTRKLSDHSDIGIPGPTTFTDQDFVLPNSLKGHTKRLNHEKAVARISTKIDKQPEKSDGNDQIKQQVPSVMERSSDTSLTVGKMLSLGGAGDGEPHKFFGYDLGQSRIQFTSYSERFTSPDGTLVMVNTEQWLYGKKRLAIGIDLAGCFLQLQNIIDHKKMEILPFHLTTENGIVVAFAKVVKHREATNFSETPGSYPTFEFGASWPSGLSMRALSGDRPENPFYIEQRYISKGSKCWNVSGHESYRKFLRNGTVLKFLNGNEVEVLRPNGTIVRCHGYKFLEGFELRDNTNLGQDVRNSERNKFSLQAETRSSGLDAARVKITRYTVFEYDGRRYEVENDEVSRVYDRSLVRTSTNVEAYEKFTRREDGTRSILNSRGELSVSFPDGTVITTGYLIEDEPLYCDWTDDEFSRFFPNNFDVRQGPRTTSMSNPSIGASPSSGSGSKVKVNSNDGSSTLSNESFVSVLMTCRMEHECYAAVAYDPLTMNCRLSMPNDIETEVSGEGLIDVNIGRDTELSLRNDSLAFSSKMSNGERSLSIYSLREKKWMDEREENEKVLLVTKDSLGRVFRVDFDGAVSRESEPETAKKAHRLFAINRDWTGCEYVRESLSTNYIGKMNSAECSELICVPVGDGGLPEYRLFLAPLVPINYSSKWLQKVTEVGPTNRDQGRFSRSTYGNPYHWLFPFGRHANGPGEKKPGQSIGDTTALNLTVLKKIAYPGDRFLRQLEKAMARCRQTTGNVRAAYSRTDQESSANVLKKQVEKWLSSLASGIDGNIDAIEYLRGLSTGTTDNKSGRALESTGECRGRAAWHSYTDEEIRWYERCLRERIILPYFKTIRGSCFLWITSCVDRALRESWNNSAENGEGTHDTDGNGAAVKSG